VQGCSYIGFGLWALSRREHYRRVHDLSGDDWLLNAHGSWHVVVGLTLAVASARAAVDRSEIRLLGTGAALGLALNDALLLPRIASIYRADLLYELGLAAWWLAERDPRT
jgi:hypothetical protein